MSLKWCVILNTSNFLKTAVVSQEDGWQVHDMPSFAFRVGIIGVTMQYTACS